MRESIQLISIRYAGLFFSIVDIIVLKDNFKVGSVVFLLLFILNNNLRVFYLKKEKSLILSIILEFILVFIGVRMFRAESLFLLIGVSIDIFAIENEYIRYGFLIFDVLFCLGLDKNPLYTLILIMVLAVLSYIKKLYESKLEAQNLYDKLRVSEEKLLLANKELEGYALSIEELTLLKERNRISREIHDSVGHSLSTAMIQLNAMEALLKKEENPVGEMAGNLRS
ncbi:histidine kinase dimerization/phosphoacceptor domain-containing protein, partial [uncultured Clostridium sp.]|uniref:histidine kinase dimerization/phosphoacceptor domain-containing protein n=1 Tax=uncultured Clostridium sp. TaxID=59620 RepID=UPI002606AB68